jgi:3-oxoadipate enol-lactonase
MPVLDANGETIHYIKEGDGPAVVLIHSLGASSEMWRKTIGSLADRYSLVACDARGHGQSSAKGECTVPNLVQDLKAVVDHLGIGPCNLVGISTGGAVALTYAAQHPVNALVLADSFAKPVEGSRERVEATAEAVAYVSMEEFGTQYAAETLLPATSLDIQDELAASIAKVNPKVYIQLMRSVLLGDFTAQLGAIKIPTMVLIGEEDITAPMSESQFLADSIPGALLKTVPAAGHLACLDNPAAFSAEVGRFFDVRR